MTAVTNQPKGKKKKKKKSRITICSEFLSGCRAVEACRCVCGQVVLVEQNKDVPRGFGLLCTIWREQELVFITGVVKFNLRCTRNSWFSYIYVLISDISFFIYVHKTYISRLWPCGENIWQNSIKLIWKLFTHSPVPQSTLGDVPLFLVELFSEIRSCDSNRTLNCR